MNSNEIKYVGVFDNALDLFEGQYKIPEGISYNSYIIIDEKIAIFDSVDIAFRGEWLKNIDSALDGRMPDYLIVQHMEPDHSANIFEFASKYADAKIVASKKAFDMMRAFFGTDFAERQIIVKEGDELSLGKHVLSFITAPMVHWPEVILTYDKTDKLLFCADAFGKFGSTDSSTPWANEARRYYIGIVGKYGAQVQSLLKKVSSLDIRAILPLHGPTLTENLSYYISLYDIWSKYEPEEKGVLIACASVYGNTLKAAKLLKEKLEALGVKAELYDLTRCDMSEVVAEAFRYDGLVTASVTYNAEIFPCMRSFITALAERGFKKRKVGFIENGSWAPMAAKVMKGMFDSLDDISYCENSVKITSAVSSDTVEAIDSLARELAQ